MPSTIGHCCSLRRERTCGQRLARVQTFSYARQYAHGDSSSHACSQLQTHTSAIWQPYPSRALICCCAGTIATILTSATCFSQNKPKLVASIALNGQRKRNCGTLDHLNVDFCPNQALAELSQVMFDLLFSGPHPCVPRIAQCYGVEHK